MQHREVATFIRELAIELRAACQTHDEAISQAWMLLTGITKLSRSQLMMARELDLTDLQLAQLQVWVKHRVKERKPIQYVLGAVPFCDILVQVRPPILIPRPETEELVAWLISKLEPVSGDALTIVDMCTGSGCIALSLARALPHATIYGLDINPEAIDLARENAVLNNLPQVTFIQSDLFAQLPAGLKIDVLVANPPYIATHELEQLEPEVKHWEDHVALHGGSDGLTLYRRLIMELKTHLTPDSPLTKNKLPRMVCELGNDAQGVVVLLEKAGFAQVDLHNDIHGGPRWVSAEI